MIVVFRVEDSRNAVYIVDIHELSGILSQRRG